LLAEKRFNRNLVNARQATPKVGVSQSLPHKLATLLAVNQRPASTVLLLRSSFARLYICVIRIQYLTSITMAIATQAPPIGLTARALVEVRNIIQEKSVPADYGLRIGVQGGGCSGMSYLLGFDKAKDNDEIYDLDGVQLIMDKKHAMYVLGMEVDFQDGLNARGFTFNNPQAKSTCGCGSSFSA
jgi:iron-sulfur cluster assembly protein